MDLHLYQDGFASIPRWICIYTKMDLHLHHDILTYLGIEIYNSLKGGEVAVLKTNYLVEKRNVLNEIRSNNMTMQELRFFSIYLSKINQRDINTRVVRFPIDDFKAIMELGRIDINYIKNVTNSLLSKVVNVPIEDKNGKIKGYKGFQLFKECEVSQDNNGEWYVEIDAHDLSLPLMFDFKNKYFAYQLWNALRLKSSNQLRMYEILKQYQALGYRVLNVEVLRDLLGVRKDEYPRYNDFKKWVLDACQQSLQKHTDIKFTYEPQERRGKGRKIISLKFTIKMNDNYIDQMTLLEFIEDQKAAGDREYNNDNINSPCSDRINFLVNACNGEFSYNQVVTLHDKMRNYIPYEEFKNQPYCYQYLNSRYNEMMRHAEKGCIRTRFGYVKSLIGQDI